MAVPCLTGGDVLYTGRGAALNNYLFAADLTIYNPQTHEAAQGRSIEKYHVFLDSLQQSRIQLRQTLWPQKFSPEAEAFLVGEIVFSTFNHKYMAEVYKIDKTAEDSAALTTPALRTYRQDYTAFTLHLMAMFIDGQDSLAVLTNDFIRSFQRQRIIQSWRKSFS